MPVPKNLVLYEKVKKSIYRKMPIHSAYRSGHVVKKYKALGGTFIGGPKNQKTGLSRWFAENWKSDRGRYGYTSKSSVYRPTIRVTSRTPVTFSELSRARLLRAKREKGRTGHVKRF